MLSIPSGNSQSVTSVKCSTFLNLTTFGIIFYSSMNLDGGGAGGGHLRRPGLRPQGGGGKATQSRPRECHRPHDLSR